MLATMLQRGFKALNISITNISCERSIFTILPHRDQTTAGQLEKRVLKPMLAILTTYMETRLKNTTKSHYI